MIEITAGSLEGQIIKILQKKYPVTLNDLQKELRVAKPLLLRELKKLQTKGIVRLDQLPDTIYIRLMRHDFCFVGRKQQKKPVKHRRMQKKYEPKEYDGIMYT
ncbi:MAG: transcriptional regulator [Methanobacteriota archaeon]